MKACENCGSKKLVVTMGMLTQGTLIEDNLILQENEPFDYKVSVRCQNCGKEYQAKDFGFRVKKTTLTATFVGEENA